MRNIPVVVAAMLAVDIVSPAQALIIVHTDSFSGSTLTAIAGVPEFDPGLGTLDRVTVEIDGEFSLGYTLPPLAAIAAPSVDLDAQGAARGFDFALAGARATFLPVLNASTTTPLSGVFSSSFGLSFALDAITDLAGLTVASFAAPGASVSIPPIVDALRSDFVQGIAPIGVSETLILQANGFSPTSVSFAGAMIVTYDYTPAPAPAVPTPTPLALLAVAPLIAALTRRGSRPSGRFPG